MPLPDLRATLRSLEALAGPLPEWNVDAAANDPMDQFGLWLQQAIEAKVPEPHAMVLSTVDEGNAPDSRFLLLKGLDEAGWHFATNRNSPKGLQILKRDTVALAFYWPMLGRQVRIRGNAVDLGRERGAEDFLARSPGSRASALVSRQSKVLDDVMAFDVEFKEQCRRITESPGIIDPDWTVYAVNPQQVEFWQGSADRRHRRLLYTRMATGWDKQALRP